MLPHRSRIAHSAWLAAALLAVAGFATAPAGAATNGAVAGNVTTKIPAGSTATVVATSLADGTVVSALPLSKSGAFNISLPAGAYTISTVVSPAPGGGAASTARFPVSLKRGQKRSKIKVKTKRSKSKPKTSAAATRSYVQEKGQVTPGVAAFAVEDFTGAPSTGEWQFMNQALTDILITDLVGKTPCKTAVVANKRDRKLLERELELQKSKYFDPKTRVKRNFIISDLTVGGTIAVAADQQSAQVNVTITDARTGKLVDSFTSTLPFDGFFAKEEALAKSIAERVCRRPAAYKVTLGVQGSGDFATHSSTGRIDAELTALRSGGEAGQPPTAWTGVGQLSWASVTLTSKAPPCSYSDAISPVTSWQVKLAISGETDVKLDWESIGNDAATGTVTCPSDDGPPAIIPGQPGPALLGIAPKSATLPLTGGTIPLSGGFTSGGDGWTNSGVLVVTPVWAKDAP